MYKKQLVALGFVLLAGTSSVVQAAQIESLIPTGRINEVSSVKARFSEPVIRLGRADSPDPLRVECDHPTLKGHGKWSDPANWSYDFEGRVPSGVTCTLAPNPDFRDLQGNVVQSKAEYSFNTGGPRVDYVIPYGDRIDEDQAFVITFSAPVNRQSLAQKTVCTVSGYGEQIPVRVFEQAEKQALLKQSLDYLLDREGQVEVVQCNRRLPANGKMQLFIDKGLEGVGGLLSALPYERSFDVREPFKVSFSCLRENQNAACMPVKPVSLVFSAPVPFEQVKAITLEVDGKTHSPAWNDDNTDDLVDSVRFAPPFPENAAMQVVLPADFRDDAGRELGNAGQFPLKSSFGRNPPLVKFASSTFGIIEKHAETAPGKSLKEQAALVPLTVRNVESDLQADDHAISPGQVSDFVPQSDQDVLNWFHRVRRLEDARYSPANIRAIMNDQDIDWNKEDAKTEVDTRSVSVLSNIDNVAKINLPVGSKNNERDFEVIGLPLQQPGFHVLEVKSGHLGQSLLKDRNPMYVRTSVLLTNLAVHVKKGKDDFLVWVTTLDDAKPVANAQINVLACDGQVVGGGQTNEQGIWHFRKAIKGKDYCESNGMSGFFVSARIPESHPMANGEQDYSFAFTSWERGIEAWRFNVPVGYSEQPDLKTHTVFDRSLFRAGETVSMKHFIRTETRDGFSLPNAERLPTQLTVAHIGSSDSYDLPVEWKPTPSGGLSATSSWVIPKSAKLGEYEARFDSVGNDYFSGASFRVESFKLPLLTGSLKVTRPGQDSAAIVAPHELDLDMQLNYIAGGAAGQLPVSISAMARDRSVAFADYDGFSFDPPRSLQDDDEEEDGYVNAAAARLFVDKKQVVLDAKGGARVLLDGIPDVKQAKTFTFEASFMDPNGEIQTLNQQVAAWPSNIVAGIRTGYYFEKGKQAKITALALTPAGKPVAQTPIRVQAIKDTAQTVRKRLVGGFYSYDTQRLSQDMGTVCEGSTDNNGLLECDLALAETGRISLVAQVQDAQGNKSQAASSVWVIGQEELWFAGENNDRIDLIPERKVYAAGDKAQFQVRMPFRQATALLAVEREGVLEARVVEIDGKDPVVSVDIKPEWGPNVYVSVLAVRGRVRQAPGLSLFNWGKDPDEVSAPTAMIDLAKPAFRFGLTGIRVQSPAHKIDLQLSTNKEQYKIRETAQATIKGVLPDGKPAAGATVAVAVVDQALLELSDNPSWKLLEGMMGIRPYSVETATAQSEIIGRRHYGRKALPPGGGGGTGAPTRELLDTLLLWKPDVVLNEQGEATIDVPLNDVLSRFKVVAVADHGVQLFGDKAVFINTTQALQIISGLPQVVREGDRYQAVFTVRNSSARDMKTRVQASFTGTAVAPQPLPAQTLELAAGTSGQVRWDVSVPTSASILDKQKLTWTLRVAETGTGEALDQLRVTQEVSPATPVTVRQAALLAVTADTPVDKLQLQVAPESLQKAGRFVGGVQVQLQPTLSNGLENVRKWFNRYPYTCLEQVSSIAVGLYSPEKWNAIMAQLPSYLDQDGLAMYFPSAILSGDEVLTAYLISMADEAQKQGIVDGIPDAYRERMLEGLQNYVTGKLRRNTWSPVNDNVERRLLALEALSRYGMVTPSLLATVKLDTQKWSTAALIDWMNIITRVKAIPNRNLMLERVRHALVARMDRQGTAMVFADTERNSSWWLMLNNEANMGKLLLAVMGSKMWENDIPHMMQGLLQMQQKGAWSTTTANLWGTLAVGQFSRQFESIPAQGSVTMTLAPQTGETQTWENMNLKQKVFSPWAGTAQESLSLLKQGPGRVWATVSALAAVPVIQPAYAGYVLEKTIEPLSRASETHWTQGDIYRVRLLVKAKSAMNWVIVSDPVPAGATILGSGLGRDSQISTAGEKNDYWDGPSFIERHPDVYRAYYQYLPAGESVVEYTVRLNTAGQFVLPPTRVEAMYAPNVYGELPNTASVEVQGQ